MRISENYPGGRLDEATIERWHGQLGITQVEDTIYSTSLSRDDMACLANWISDPHGRTVCFWGEIERDLHFTKYTVVLNYIENQVHRRFLRSECMLRGRFLRISEGLLPSDYNKQIRISASQLLSRAFLIAGRGAILSEMSKATIHLPEQNAISMSVPQSHIPGDECVGDWYRNGAHDVDQQMGPAMVLKPTASKYWVQAMLSRDFSTSFLFLWISLEAQIGRGKARRHYCLNELSSEKASDLLNIVRGARDSFVHEGVRSAITSDHYEVAHAFLRIASLEKGTLRRDLVAKLEAVYDLLGASGFGTNLSEGTCHMTFTLDELTPPDLRTAVESDKQDLRDVFDVTFFEAD